MARITDIDGPLRFDRWDMLATKLAAILVAVGVPFGSVVSPTIDHLRGKDLVWSLARGESGPRIADVKAGVSAHYGSGVEVRLTEASTGTWLASLLPGLILSITTVLVAVLLWRLLVRIQSGEPFVERSVWYLRGIGGALLIGSLLYTIANSIAAVAVSDAAFTGTPSFMLNLLPVLSTMAVGMVVAAIAEAFARGVALQQDVDGLV